MTKTEEYDYESAEKYGATPEPYARDIDPATGKPRMHMSSHFKKDTHPNRFIMSERGIFDTKYGEILTVGQFAKVATPAQIKAIAEHAEVIPGKEVDEHLQAARENPGDVPARGTTTPRRFVPSGMINRGK